MNLAGVNLQSGFIARSLKKIMFVPSVMVTGSKARMVTVILHVLVWALLTYILFVFPPIGSKKAVVPDLFIYKQVFHMLLMVMVYYLNTYLFVPKLLLKGYREAFAVCIILIMLFAGLFMARIEVWFGMAEHLERAFGKKIWHNGYIDFFGLFTTMFVLGISSSIAISQQWSSDWKLRQELETERAVAELAFLKAQINPHFFFNTLNSIYALTYIDTESSRKVLLKLSAMMRYLLYETQHDATTVSKELTFIRNYIEIMQQRLSDNTQVEFTIPETVRKLPIAPMLLLPFVENAFKHGVDDQNTGTISITIDETDDGLGITVKNHVIIPDIQDDIGGKGIGLVNTRRRLDLLYPDKYSLQITHNGQTNEYVVHLALKLK